MFRLRIRIVVVSEKFLAGCFDDAFEDTAQFAVSWVGLLAIDATSVVTRMIRSDFLAAFDAYCVFGTLVCCMSKGLAVETADDFLFAFWFEDDSFFGLELERSVDEFVSCFFCVYSDFSNWHVLIGVSIEEASD